MNASEENPTQEIEQQTRDASVEIDTEAAELVATSEFIAEEEEMRESKRNLNSSEMLMLHNNTTIDTNSDNKSAENDEATNTADVEKTSSDKGESRKVSFPKDNDLVTGYLEPVNPWADVLPVTSIELCDFYKESCLKHNTEPLEVILEHLKILDFDNETRATLFDIHEQKLTHESVETLEEILKRVQYKKINISSCGLDDISASAIFDMIEYYEATNELDISENKDITNRGWQSCVNMVKRSQELKALAASGTPLSEQSATSLGKALIGSSLHTLKLEHCGMTGRPIAALCHTLRKTNVLKELWLANNDLNSFDAYNIAGLLKINHFIQFIDMSNNNIQDEGISYLTDALSEQTNHFKNPTENTSSRMNYSELSANLNYINNNKCLSPSFKKPLIQKDMAFESSLSPSNFEDRPKIHLLSKNNNNNIEEEDEDEKETVKYESRKIKEKSPPPPPMFESATESSEFDGKPNSDEDVEVQDLLQQSPDSASSVENVPIIETVMNPMIRSDINKLNANFTEVATQTTTEEPVKESSINNHDPAVDITPPNTKSLKEELEDCVPSSNEKPDNTLPNRISPIIKISDAINIETSVVNPLLSHESKSLDTDSEIESIVKHVPLTSVDRSVSSESLNSITSVDSNDSKSSIRITEAKFAKNGTLERQQSALHANEPSSTPTGLQVLLLWNNKLTKNSSKSFSELIGTTTTLEMLNVGRNNLGNDFLAVIKTSLKNNTSLQSFGLQGCHLSCIGAKILADIIQFGGNSTLQRIDLRDNNIQTDGLEALNDVLKSNKSITQIDLDETPRKLSETFDCAAFNRLINNIKAHCDRNANPPPVLTTPEQSLTGTLNTTSTTVRTIQNNNGKQRFLSSRKISLTCQNVLRNSSPPTDVTNLSSVSTIKSPSINNRSPIIDSLSYRPSSAPSSSSLPTICTSSSGKSKKKCSRLSDASKNRLKSPVPSPLVSPLASPSRNRFQVSKVAETSASISGSAGLSPSPGSLSTGSSPTFFPNSRFSVTRVVLPPTPVKATSTGNLLTPTSSTLLSDSALSSSMESPDMEVKRYMNESCSSSSLDSMDRQNELNVSMSSTDSFDFILRDVPHVETGLLKDSSLGTAPPIPTVTAVVTNTRINDSLSSLEVSASSQESLDMSSDQSPKVSSNEGTLTNSPCTTELRIDDPIDTITDTSVKSKQSDEKRTRKNAWSYSFSKGESGHPATLDKLFSLFQPTNISTNISTLFSRSSPDMVRKEEPSSLTRKDSPMGGLFAWATGRKESPDNTEYSSTTDVHKLLKTNVLQPNHSPENSINEPHVSVSVEAMSKQLKNEVKENISPENTITASSVSNIKSQSTPVLEPKLDNPKVIFELGDDTDKEDTSSSNDTTDSTTVVRSENPDEEKPLLRDSTGNNKNLPPISPDTFGLGHIARDSLSIIKGGVNTSQDSMRSLDSLPEFEQFDSDSTPFSFTISSSSTPISTTFVDTSLLPEAQQQQQQSQSNQVKKINENSVET